MTTILAILMTLTFNIHFTFIITTTTTMVVASTTTPTRLVTKLIHHDSIFSPYYNPKDTIEDRAQRSLNSSIARLAYLSAGAHDIRANLVPNRFNNMFYINFSIGQPPISVLAAMDTGSTLTWVKCLPCTPCSQESGIVFNPSKSSTYALLPCTRCIKCNYSLNKCPYNMTYVDGSTSEGVIATEQFTFETSDEGTVTVSDVVFGCGRKLTNFKVEVAGVFGLGTVSSISLVNKLGSKFSYCIGNLRDRDYKYNQLIIGDGAEMEGYSTPFVKIDGLYYITQEGISVGEKRLDIDANIFKKTTNDNGVIIDSGSTNTWLARSAYDTLRKEVEALLEDSILRYCVKSVDNLCCMGTISQGLSGFPVITFHFANGADLELDAWSSFIQAHSYGYCLAIRPSDSDFLGNSYSKNFTMIGIMAQQSYNVGYDLEANSISFQRIDCELLAD